MHLLLQLPELCLTTRLPGTKSDNETAPATTPIAQVPGEPTLGTGARRQQTLDSYFTLKRSSLNPVPALSKKQKTTKQYVKQDLNYDDSDFFGDDIQTKGTNTVRIVFQNINRLGIDSSLQWKLDRFITLAKEYEFDVVGWAEINLNWKIAKPHRRLKERLRSSKWDRLEVATAHNRQEKLHFYQPGGTSMMAYDQTSYRASASGADDLGLGRWSWMLLRGKTANVRIVTAYIPCTMKAEDTNTVWAQQNQYLKYIGWRTNHSHARCK